LRISRIAAGSHDEPCADPGKLRPIHPGSRAGADLTGASCRNILDDTDNLSRNPLIVVRDYDLSAYRVLAGKYDCAVSR
jgi:hypothetical protein